MEVIEKIFHVKAKGSSLKKEIIGGLIVFVAMCYILPVNANILSDGMGMDRQGVFAMTALVGAFVTLIMGIVANYPIVLSAGMGLNAYIAYGLSGGFDWHQKMIILTVTGILFFVFSLTPIRKKIVEAIPKGLKCAISAGLGAFIAYVGLLGAGIIDVKSGAVPSLGNLTNPAILIALLACILCFGLMFVKNKHVANLAVPLAVLFAAVVGLIASVIIHYGLGETANPLLPTIPWADDSIKFGASGMEKVVFFGALDGYTGDKFVSDLGAVFSAPQTYIAIFSMMFVNLFDTTATLIAVGGQTGIIADDGSMKDYHKVVLADAAGAAICAPLGTSTVTSFVESNVGVSLGARTGLAAVVAALMFTLSAFIYPIFAVFTAPSVTAAALLCVGGMIFVNNIKEINLEDKILGFSAFIILIMSLLTYSISNGIGLGFMTYCLMMLIAGRRKEVSPVIYGVAGAFIVLFAVQAVMTLL